MYEQEPVTVPAAPQNVIVVMSKHSSLLFYFSVIKTHQGFVPTSVVANCFNDPSSLI